MLGIDTRTDESPPLLPNTVQLSLDMRAWNRRQAVWRPSATPAWLAEHCLCLSPNPEKKGNHPLTIASVSTPLWGAHPSRRRVRHIESFEALSPLPYRECARKLCPTRTSMERQAPPLVRQAMASCHFSVTQYVQETWSFDRDLIAQGALGTAPNRYAARSSASCIASAVPPRSSGVAGLTPANPRRAASGFCVEEPP